MAEIFDFAQKKDDIMATVGKCSLKLPLVTSCCSYELVQESYYICAKERGILPKEWNQFTSNVSTRPILFLHQIG
jgi:hypothetical protein